MGLLPRNSTLGSSVRDIIIASLCRMGALGRLFMEKCHGTQVTTSYESSGFHRAWFEASKGILSAERS